MNILLVTFLGLIASFEPVLGTPVPNEPMPFLADLVTTYDAVTAPHYYFSKELLGDCVQLPINQLRSTYPHWNVIAYSIDAPGISFSKQPTPLNPPEFYCGAFKYALARVDPGTIVRRGNLPAGYQTWAFYGEFEHKEGSPVVKFKKNKRKHNRKRKHK